MNINLLNSAQRIISIIVIMSSVLVYTINSSITLQSQMLPSSRPKRSIDSQPRNHRRRHRHGNVTTMVNSAVNASESAREYATVIRDDGKDVPRFVCGDGELACALPSEDGLVLCIAREKMCDYKIDCPGGTDEDPTGCTFLRLQQQPNTASGVPSSSCKEHENRIAALEQDLRALEDYVIDVKNSLDIHRHCGSSERVVFADSCPTLRVPYQSRRIRHSGT